MKMVVVGGNSHGIGKSSVAAAIIASLPQRNWLAIKLSQSGHHAELGETGGNDLGHHRGPEAANFAIREERDRSGTTDSSRFLAAGAQRALWISVSDGTMDTSIPEIMRAIDGHENVIVESNGILRFFEPTIYISVLDPSTSDFKASARKYLDRADAFLSLGPLPEKSPWSAVSLATIRQKPLFILGSNHAIQSDRRIIVPRAACEFVESRLGEESAARYLFS